MARNQSTISSAKLTKNPGRSAGKGSVYDKGFQLLPNAAFSGQATEQACHRQGASPVVVSSSLILALRGGQASKRSMRRAWAGTPASPRAPLHPGGRRHRKWAFLAKRGHAAHSPVTLEDVVDALNFLALLRDLRSGDCRPCALPSLGIQSEAAHGDRSLAGAPAGVHKRGSLGGRPRFCGRRKHTRFLLRARLVNEDTTTAVAAASRGLHDLVKPRHLRGPDLTTRPGDRSREGLLAFERGYRKVAG